MVLGKFFLVLLSIVVFTVQSAVPQGFTRDSASRDVAVDSMLFADGGLAGPLPPTGSAAGVVPTTATTPGAVPGILNFPVTAGEGEDLKDHKGNVIRVTGDVQYSKQGEHGRIPLKNGTAIEPGHFVLTNAGAEVTISFDNQFLNVIHIPENTMAEFKTVEPTEVYLQDGTVFSVLDNLPKGESWKVVTPVAVASVRGTHYVVSFLSATGELWTITFNVPDDGTNSFVELTEIQSGTPTDNSVNIPEGQQINLDEGVPPDPSLLTKIDQNWLDQIVAILDFLMWLRDLFLSGASLLPATGSDGSLLSFLFSGDETILDPLLDTNTIGGDDPISGSGGGSGDDHMTQVDPPDLECENEECIR